MGEFFGGIGFKEIRGENKRNMETGNKMSANSCNACQPVTMDSAASNSSKGAWSHSVLQMSFEIIKKLIFLSFRFIIVCSFLGRLCFRDWFPIFSF